jgi:hypothetical protein
MGKAAVFARRLTKLADYLQKEVAPAVKKGTVELHMDRWASVPPKPELTCGTAACAAGFATVIFAKQGFTLCRRRLRWGGSFWIVGIRGTRYRGLEACEKFFGTQRPFDPSAWGDSHKLSAIITRLRASARSFAKL